MVTTLCAQQKQGINLSGLWRGTLYNDTTGLFYKYEIGISFDNNKYSGFSHTYFLKGDKEYYGVKKLEIHQNKDGELIVRDDGLIANNYPEPPAKGVKQTNILSLVQQDSILVLEGPYSTNSTKTFRAITGHVRLQRKSDYWRSALIPHLQELGKADVLSFIKTDIQNLVAKKDISEKIITITKPQKEEKVTPVSKAPQLPTEAVSTKQEKDIVLKKEVQSITGPSSKARQTNNLLPVSRIVINEPPAAHAFERITLLEQTVEFSSDSLILFLYDNGEVDGDTVSVLMDGELLLAREGLSTTAIKKTIYINPQKDEVELVLYAENLGKIPPNTGLLVVRDGKSIYEVRFSGDYQKNAAIRLKRKR